MVARRKRPDGLPFRLYEWRGRRIVSFWYKHKDGTREVLMRAPIVNERLVAKAKREAIRQASLLNTGEPLQETVSDLMQRYFDWQDEMPVTAELRKAQSTLDENKRESKNLVRFFGEMLPESVKPKHCYAFQDLRIQDGAGAKANKELALLSAVFEYGRRKGVLEVNPCRGIQRVPTRPKSFLMHEEDLDFVLSVGRSLGGSYLIQALAACACYLTVRRPSEILSLTFEQITDEGIEFISAKRKAGQSEVRGLIVWSAALREVVDEARIIHRHHGWLGCYVFGNQAGQVYSRSGWGTIWRRLMVHCEKQAKEQGRAFARFALADCRPAAVTSKQARGDSDTQDATLHSDGRMIARHYDRRRVRIATPTR